jgi:hypothetical protein
MSIRGMAVGRRSRGPIWTVDVRLDDSVQIRGVEIIFAGDADQSEEGIAPGVGERSPHATGRCDTVVVGGVSVAKHYFVCARSRQVQPTSGNSSTAHDIGEPISLLVLPPQERANISSGPARYGEVEFDKVEL